MNQKKVDNRIRVIIENNVISGFRTIFAIIGPKARDQVVLIHHMLIKSQIKPKPVVLWCYKKELGFSTNRRKRMRMLKKKERTGNACINEDDPFEMFISGTNIRWCYYHETDRILGNTYDMLVLQDFEAITPNLLARTVETVEGGGIVVFLLNTLSSLQQLHDMAMDVHNRYRTEAHKDVVARFNKRFILSLTSCPNFIGIDDKLNVLPLSSHIKSIEPLPKPDPSDPLPPRKQKLIDLKKSLIDRQPLGSLVNCCRTFDQAKAVMEFVESLAAKDFRITTTMTSARGRGKSAALGLAIAGAIAYGYENVYVTSPSPQNLKTLFDFIIKGLDAIHYKQHLDFDVIQSNNPDFNKATIRIEVNRDDKQVIQYISPQEASKDPDMKKNVELLVIDEAAAIPLPIVRSLLGQYMIFMSSTISGYEGTGRSLSLKLIKQLREESEKNDSEKSRVLKEVVLDESIRYSMGDPVEAWLNQLLCLEVNEERLKIKNDSLGLNNCELFWINRNILFSFHPASEAFLQKLMALYVASHYKNSPNDLQMMSDAPAHHLFCLLSKSSYKQSKSKVKVPEILCFIQVCLEGEITEEHMRDNSSKGKAASGDLIPWTLSQQFQDSKFPSLCGARIVRIATNPNYQGMGFGKKSMELLESYYQGKLYTRHSDYRDDDLMETDDHGDNLDSESGATSSLLTSVSQRRPERLDYLGVCYGLTGELFRFWKRLNFVPVYIRQTANNLTGEFSCIMVKILIQQRETSLSIVSNDWLIDFWKDFRKRFISLLGLVFRKFPVQVALDIVQNDSFEASLQANFLGSKELKLIFDEIQLARMQQVNLESRSSKSFRVHQFLDLLPAFGTLYFGQKIRSELSRGEELVLIGAGLQGKSLDVIANELNISVKKVSSRLTRTISQISKTISDLIEE